MSLGKGETVVSVGDQMSNPQTGERFVWRATRASTQGAYCEFDLNLAPSAKVAAPHRHPSQEETFEVIAGVLAGRRGGDRFAAAVGETVVIPPDTPHSWSNAAGVETHVRVRLTPSLDIEDYFESFCAIATAGGANRVGLPRNLWQLVVLLDGFSDEFAFAAPWQNALLIPVVRALAVIGRQRGYRSRVVDHA